MAHAAHLRAVADFGELALTAPPVDVLHDSAVHHAASATGAEIAFLLLADGDDDHLRLLAARGVPGQHLGRHTVPTGAGSISGYLLGHEKVAIVVDQDFRRRFDTPLLDELGVAAAASALVRIDGRRAGLLAVATTTDHEFADVDLDVLRSLATMLAHATERAAAHDQLARAAITDELTGLANRVLFLDRLRVALSRRHGSVGVVVADVHGFGDVNDALGHDAGDDLLRAIAARLVECVTPTDTVARLGGDQYAVLLEDVIGADEAVERARQLAEGVRSPPIGLRGHELHVAVAVGVAVAGQRDASADRLVREASAAVQRAKVSGRGKVEVFGEQVRSRTNHRLHLTNDLVEALAQEDLVVHYQPEVSLHGPVVWCEALVRWPHHRRGLLAPATFVGVAEDTGLVVPMGRFVLECAAAQMARWSALGPSRAPSAVSVNVSARQLIEGDLVSLTAELLDRYGLAPSSLWFELTETAVFDDEVRSEEALRALKELGVGLALDDFGTGYSSLTHVRTLPIDALKIDQSFVSGAGPGLADERIVGAALHLARACSVLTIAEGVETQEQLDRLRALGCDFVQGHVLARAGDAEAMEAFTTAHLDGREGLVEHA